MKVLFDLLPVSFTHINGVFIYAQRILEGWHQLQIKDVTVLTTTELRDWLLKSKFPNFNFITIDLPNEKLYTIKCLKTSRLRIKAINESGCDIVFYPMPEPFFFQKPNIPQVSVIHDMATGKYKWYQTKLLFPWQRHHFSKIIAISKYTKELAQKAYPWMKKDKIEVVYNAILYKEDAFPSFLQYDYILNVNTLQKYKNADTLIKAFGRIKDQTNLKLVFVGNNIFNRWEELYNIAKDYGIQDRVVHLQNLEEEQLIALYQHAKLFVTPSTIEGFGQTPVEAGIYKCPVISSKMTALPEATLGLVNYYDPVMSPDALASEMLRVLNNPPSEQELVNISERLKQEYNLLSQCQKVYDVLKSVVES